MESRGHRGSPKLDRLLGDRSRDAKGLRSTVLEALVPMLLSCSRSKIIRSLDTLKERRVRFGRFFYVTNRQIRDQDKLIEDVYRRYSVQLHCRDNSSGSLDLFKLMAAGISFKVFRV